ncbi:MAG TPA: substrate-binding domain-containing protein [Chthoniobacteraceae bacterium]|nr:substrate-binding domain-containing protein [Chthoniobacteraceae bacterium]
MTASKKDPICKAPVYRQVAAVLRAEIVGEGTPGRQLPTERELAARFRVSILTVRAAVGLLVEEGLVIREQGRGTFVRSVVRSLAGTGCIAIVLPADPTWTEGLMTRVRVMQRLKQRLHEAGRRVRLYIGDDQLLEGAEETCLPELEEDVIRHRTVEGLVVIPTLRNEAVARAVREQGLPVVGYHRGGDLQPDATAMLDYLGGLRAGLDYLHARGRRRLAVIGWAYPHVRERFPEFFKTWFAQHGLQLVPEWVRADWSPAIRGAGWEQFREIWSSHREKPDGLMVCDDYLLDDAVHAMVSLGVKVPGELEVVGQSNALSRKKVPWPIARLEYHPDDHAEALAEQLLTLLAGKPLRDPHRLFPFRLVAPEGAALDAGEVSIAIHS